MPSITRLSYAFLASAFLVLLAAPQPSTALSNHVPLHAQHAQMAATKKRMVKQHKRGGLNVLDPAATTTTTTPPAAQTTTTPAQQSTTATTTTQATGNLVDSLINGQASTTTSQSTSAVSSVTATSVSGSLSGSAATSTASSTSTSASSAAPSLNINTNTQPTATLPASTAGAQTISLVSTVAALPTSTPDTSSSDSASTFGKNTIIAIAVIAGCVGGAAAIWTLIRKWKLGPSAKFEDRMQPIEWSPDGEPGLPGGAREKGAALTAAAIGSGEKLHRSGSTGSAGSFHSAGENLGRNVTGNGNMFAEQEPHDFTAPAQTYHQYDYGNNVGYVDLHRNNSTGAPGADLSRALSNGGRPGYGHEYAQDGYAANGYEHNDAAYAQDAYGGYETYGQQAQPQYPADQYAHESRAAPGYTQGEYQGRY